MEPDHVVLSEALRQHEELAQRVETQRSMVAREIDLTAATAEWDYSQDARGRDLVVLQVRDSSGALARSVFSPVELEEGEPFRGRLRDLSEAARRVERFRADLADLYGEVVRWIERHDPAAFFREQTITLDEQRSGPYEVCVLHIHSRGLDAELRPVACWVVGAGGRVDLDGIGGREIFILQEDKGWFWVSNDPLNRLLPVTEDLFLELLGAVMT